MKNKRTLYYSKIKHLFILAISFILLCSNNVNAMSGYFYSLSDTGFSPKKRVRNVFTSNEDERLIKLIEKYGTNNWKLIAKKMKGRNMRQCKERWENYLSPNINKDAFTQEEDEIILEKQKEYGNKWKLIVMSYLPGRTEIQTRNRFMLLCRRNNKNRTSEKNKPENQTQTTNQQSNTVEANKNDNFTLLFDTFNNIIIDFDELDEFYY